MDDEQAARLVSKSLQQSLSKEEDSALQNYIRNSQNASVKNFAELARHTDLVAQAHFEDLPGLSSESKLQMQQKLDEAEKNDQAGIDDPNWTQVAKTLEADPAGSHLSMVSESETVYFSKSEGEGQAAPVSAEDEIRQSMTRFTLLRKIGSGGLGTVWLARDEMLKRNVAIKEMNATAADSSKHWHSFQREAEITGHLEHPGVVPLYMSGINGDSGMPFYAMRFLGKQTLQDAIHEFHAQRKSGTAESIDLYRLLKVFVDVCEAIAYAHSRGVVHRDLKPENIALDNFGQVMVLDWGLAKLDTEGELATRLALSGVPQEIGLDSATAGDVIGTPHYMAPEQAAGQLESLDERTDIYGLGAILYAILTGYAPHQSSQVASTPMDVQKLLKSITNEDPPKPHELNERVPLELEHICLQATARNRYARHRSAEQLAGEVEGWIAGRRERQARYDGTRMAARDLKLRLAAQLKDLQSTAQFMVALPPIQGLLDSIREGVETKTWRERLVAILHALTSSRPNLSGLSYCRVEDDMLEELVRIERSQHDVANIRSVPNSRLRNGKTNTFHKIVMQQFPGEGSVDVDFTRFGSIRIVAGVPVFDENSEEPFGLVLAEAEVSRLAKDEISQTENHGEVFLFDDSDRLLFMTQPTPANSELSAKELIPKWSEIKDSLYRDKEYQETAREYYATCLGLSQNLNSINIVFQLKS